MQKALCVRSGGSCPPATLCNSNEAIHEFLLRRWGKKILGPMFAGSAAQQVYVMNGQQYYLVPQQPGGPQQPEPALNPQTMPNHMTTQQQQPGRIPTQPGDTLAQVQPAQNSDLVADLCKIIERQSQEIANLVQTRKTASVAEAPAPESFLEPQNCEGAQGMAGVSKVKEEFGVDEEVRTRSPHRISLLPAPPPTRPCAPQPPSYCPRSA